MIDRLAALPPLADIPRVQLQWLLDHGSLQRAEDGARFYGAGKEMPGLFLVVSGRFSVRVNQGGVEREVREVTPGHPTGHLPHSKMTAPRGYLVADGPVEYLQIRLEDFPAMTRHCHEFTTLCVQEMLDRVRVFKADDKRQEKMAALGRLSAGLAHELNNPASGAARAARDLEAACPELVAASRAIGAAGLDAAAEQALRGLESVGRRVGGDSLSPLARLEQEEELADWLEARGIEPTAAHALMARGLTVVALEMAAPALGDQHLPLAVRYLAAGHTVVALLAGITSGTERIHALVAAVKQHTQMDRAPAPEPTRLEDHLQDAVTLLSAKAARKGAVVELQVDQGLPLVEATVAELNQVWMQLLDNAIDAVGAGGRIVIAATREEGAVVVRVRDDGPGIPPERQEVVFEPFFTTKDVGEGRGLGLDIVRTVVRNHHGTVQLASVPGRTEFRVAIPVSTPGRAG